MLWSFHSGLDKDAIQGMNSAIYTRITEPTLRGRKEPDRHLTTADIQSVINKTMEIRKISVDEAKSIGMVFGPAGMLIPLPRAITGAAPSRRSESPRPSSHEHRKSLSGSSSAYLWISLTHLLVAHIAARRQVCRRCNRRRG